MPEEAPEPVLPEDPLLPGDVDPLLPPAWPLAGGWPLLGGGLPGWPVPGWLGGGAAWPLWPLLGWAPW